MKKAKIFFWIVTVILILMEGVMPLITLLFAPELAIAGIRALGYSYYFAYALIICKVFGVIAIALPKVPEKLKEWAYAGLAFNLLFAAYSHLVVDQNAGFILLPIIVLLILGIAYYYHNKIKNSSLNKQLITN